MQVCLHEPDLSTSFPHEGIVKHTIHCFCSKLTFLPHIQILFYPSSAHTPAHSSFASVLFSDTSLTLTFSFLFISFSRHFFFPGETGLEQHIPAAPYRDPGTHHVHKVQDLQCFANLWLKSFWHLLSSSPSSGIIRLQQWGVHSRNRQKVSFIPHFIIITWPEPVWDHEICLDWTVCVCCMSKQRAEQPASGSHQTVHKIMDHTSPFCMAAMEMHSPPYEARVIDRSLMWQLVQKVSDLAQAK